MTFNKILILVAMKSEFSDCIEKFSFTKKSITDFGVDIFSYESSNKNIFIAQTGIGPINAGAVTALLANELKPDLVILLGLGGAISPNLAISDICIGENIIQHDAFCSFDDRVEQMASGELHLSIAPHERPDIKLKTNSFINEKLHYFLQNNGYSVFQGDILSGSEFNASLARKKIMHDKFKNAVLIEMEGCGVGLICKRMGIPFSVIKTVADTLNSDPDKEYKDYLITNSQKCADIFEFLRVL